MKIEERIKNTKKYTDVQLLFEVEKLWSRVQSFLNTVEKNGQSNNGSNRRNKNIEKSNHLKNGEKV